MVTETSASDKTYVNGNKTSAGDKTYVNGNNETSASASRTSTLLRGAADAVLYEHLLSTSEFDAVLLWLRRDLLPMLPHLQQVAAQLADVVAGGGCRGRWGMSWQVGSVVADPAMTSASRRRRRAADDGAGAADDAGSVTQRLGSALCGEDVGLPQQALRLLANLPAKSSPTSATPPPPAWCPALMRGLRLGPADDVSSSLLRRFVAPLLTGRVVYTPRNAVTDAIVSNMNTTLQRWAVQREVFSLLHLLVSQLFFSSEVSSALQEMTWVLSQPLVSSTLLQLLPQEAPQILQLLEALQRQQGSGAVMVQALLDEASPLLQLAECIELDRFVPAEDEQQLLEMAQRAHNDEAFLAGVVFGGVGGSADNSSRLPPHVSYVIRGDAARLPSSRQAGPTFWRPGPYADYGDQLLYHQGFVILQNALDEAIMKTLYQQTSSTTTRSASAAVGLHFDQSAVEDVETIFDDTISRMNSHIVKDPFEDDRQLEAWMDVLTQLRGVREAFLTGEQIPTAPRSSPLTKEAVTSRKVRAAGSGSDLYKASHTYRGSRDLHSYGDARDLLSYGDSRDSHSNGEGRDMRGVREAWLTGEQTPTAPRSSPLAKEAVTSRKGRATESGSDSYNASDKYGDGRDPHSYGDVRDPNSYGDVRDPRSYGDGRDPHSYGDSRDSHSNGEGRDLRSFGDSRDTFSYGDARDSHSYGDGRDAHSLGNSSFRRRRDVSGGQEAAFNVSIVNRSAEVDSLLNMVVSTAQMPYPCYSRDV
ncbi:uncharacterized protein LOC125178116 [Hyalella azteca]|uniref:Uncharacterized protein LOC125178116 n=1 Tax=Hyalella azteca TaxID=294128 RepID=A0A979FK70_HYAAZ|nr:uncharacterized protein LOC125178116 [Hyalella azteca]